MDPLYDPLVALRIALLSENQEARTAALRAVAEVLDQVALATEDPDKLAVISQTLGSLCLAARDLGEEIHGGTFAEALDVLLTSKVQQSKCHQCVRCYDVPDHPICQKCVHAMADHFQQSPS